MKKITFTIFLLLLHINCIAQTKYKTVYQDTINLRGIVLDYKENPMPGILLSSSNYYSKNKGRIYAKTDSAGKFQLIGAKFNDTIFIPGPTGLTIVYNRGSRYMEIKLRTPYIQQIASLNPILITSIKKTSRKLIPVKFKINNETCFDCDGFIEQNAEYPGGIDKFINLIQKKIIYPQQAIDSSVEGTVEVGFSVYKDGTLGDFKILRGIGYGCDEEVINIIKTSRQWKPGMLAGKILVVPETVSVQFKLTDK